MSKTFHHSDITTEVELYAKRLRIEFAFVITFTFVIIFSILTVVYYFGSIKSFAIQACFLILCICCLLIIRSAKNHKLVFILYSVTGTISPSIALVFFHDSIHFVELLWMLGSISMAYFFIGKKLGTILLIFSLIAIFTFIFFTLDNYIVIIAQPNTYQKFMLAVEMVFGLGLNVYLFYIYNKINKFTTLKLREANNKLISRNLKIRHQNSEKTILIKEVYHRVKNNLQIIISLLRIQSEKIKTKEVKSYFQESINQIMAISLVHQKLYKSENLSQIKFSEYANELISTIISTDAKKRNIQFKVTSKIDKIGLESLVPMGLIINELTLNSLKHAFTDEDENGEIELNVRGDTHNKWIYMMYADSGHWTESKTTKDGFGQILMEALAEQLDGAFKIKKKENKTIYLFRFKNTIDTTDFYQPD